MVTGTELMTDSDADIKSPPGGPIQISRFSLHYAGIHRQEDRDSRPVTSALGRAKKLWHMVRIRVPLGVLSPAQYVALDNLAQESTHNSSLRVTAGQSIQLHGVAERHLPRVLATLEQINLAAGCHPAGFEFAIAVSPLQIENEAYRQLRGLALDLSEGFYPRPGRSLSLDLPDHSPRKFAIGLAIEDDNTGNVFVNDLGLLLLKREGRWRMNVFAGGSLSMPTKRPDTYARLASPLGSIEPRHAVKLAGAVAAVFKRFGQLPTRRHTRLKYVVDQLGLDWFRSEVEKEGGFAFDTPASFQDLKVPSWSGAHDLQNGTFSYGLPVPFGRIEDTGEKRYKTAIREIVETLRLQVILGPDQSVLFAGLKQHQVKLLEQILGAYHVPYGAQITPVRSGAMACAGLPTCPKAIAESERAAPSVVQELEQMLIRIGRGASPFNFRISGCSIGCIRPNMVDLGAIARRPGHYDLYVGGDESRALFGELYAESIPLKEIVPSVSPLLEAWAKYGTSSESFSRFYSRAFRSGTKPTRLVSCEAVPARERVEKLLPCIAAPKCC